MVGVIMRALTAGMLVALIGACGRAPHRGAPVPERPTGLAREGRSRLPPIPLVEGALGVRVVYPRDSALITSRDSNFIFGSVGHGRASLTINGTRVPVERNGAFIAFLPNPPQEAPRYELAAVLGADTARHTVPVRLLPARPDLPLTGPLIVDTASLFPREYTLRPADELVPVGIRAPENAILWLESADGRRLGLSSAGAEPGVRQSRAMGQGVPTLRYRGDPTFWAAAVPAALFRAPVSLVAARERDTVRIPIVTIDPYDAPAPWSILGADSAVVGDTDRVVFGRPTPGGTYGWLLLPGTLVPMTGATGEFVRVRLDEWLEVWVNGEDVRVPPAGIAPPRRVVTSVEVRSAAGWADIVIPMVDRPPFLVEQRADALVLTLYATTVSPGLIRYLENDTLVRHIAWEQESTDRARLTVNLSGSPFGYLAFWDRGAFVLRVRRPPAIDRRGPLRGLTIAVDAGHPPAGATGPTGLYEGDAVLPVAQRARELLEERGATVVMTRTTADPFPLADRPIVARRADAHALLSVHLNALPDGVNPFRANGTSVLFFHRQAEPLARAVQRRLVERLGLRDLGVHYQNIALGRPTWMPAVLAEGLFIMMPEHEAAMRSREGREAYARGMVDGLEDYFRALGAGTTR